MRIDVPQWHRGGVGWIVFAALLVALAYVFRSTSGLDGAIKHALAHQELGRLREALAATHSEERPTAYDQAIARFWEQFERKLACELIGDLAEEHDETKIAQYWMHQALVTEPAIARERLTPDFLERYYKPEVAATCGRFG